MKNSMTFAATNTLNECNTFESQINLSLSCSFICMQNGRVYNCFFFFLTKTHQRDSFDHITLVLLKKFFFIIYYFRAARKIIYRKGEKF